MLDAIDLIGSAPDLGETLRRTAEVAVALTQSTYGLVELEAEDQPRRRVEHGGPPDGGELLELELAAHGSALGRLVLRRPAPEFEPGEVEVAERLAALAGPFVANAVAYDQSERRRRWLEGTVEVAAALAPTMRPEDARAELVAGVRRAAGAPLVALLLGDGPDDDRWYVAAHDGDGDEATTEEEAVEAASALGDRIAAAGEGQVLFVERSRGVETLLLPLTTTLAPPAVLLVEHSGTFASPGGLERHLLSTFAGQVSLALDRAHAIGERQSLLIAADRDRIARDLHDLVIQRLYATGLSLQASRKAGGDALDAAVTASVRDIDTSIRDLRATIFELGRGRSSTLTGEARALVEEYAGVLGHRPSLRLVGPVDTALTPAVADDVLLVLREALSNIARHADATAAQVELTASAAWFMLRVSDDGVGMTPEPGVPSGLRNAQRRAEALGGVMRMGSASPRGTSLVWMVPAAG
jgi:signal transduction histidine kinase